MHVYVCGLVCLVNRGFLQMASCLTGRNSFLPKTQIQYHVLPLAGRSFSLKLISMMPWYKKMSATFASTSMCLSLCSGSCGGETILCMEIVPLFFCGYPWGNGAMPHWIPSPLLPPPHLFCQFRLPAVLVVHAFSRTKVGGRTHGPAGLCHHAEDISAVGPAAAAQLLYPVG